MEKFQVAVATRNTKTLYLSVQLLEELGLSFVICPPNDIRCASAKVVITDTDDPPCTFNPGRQVVVSGYFDRDIAAIEIMMNLFEIDAPHSLAIGVDPGLRFGLALVADGTAVYAKTLCSPGEAAKDTENWVSELASHTEFPHPIVRVGTGSRLYAALYLRELSLSENTTVEMVDESHTTLSGASDESSAALIALRHGRDSLESDFYLEPKRGYIRSLRHLVRSLSQGRVNLTVSQARDVLLGRARLSPFLE
ncbi:MAG: hypothetical protein KGY80_00985 [Candidatus Thorarchaeota archaeon]|nr:hypothetical protein [Candidatus Thorarchaeota archaeon]